METSAVNITSTMDNTSDVNVSPTMDNTSEVNISMDNISDENVSPTMDNTSEVNISFHNISDENIPMDNTSDVNIPMDNTSDMNVSPTTDLARGAFEFWRNIAEEKLKNTKIQLTRLQPVDVEFVDLCYTIPESRTRNKTILKNVSGCFKSGELTAIMGPSGAGKTTLLSILAGYNSCDKPHSVLMNGEPRNMKVFRKLSRYIMQEDVHQPSLTVLESMLTAADLKLGNSVTGEQKMCQIVEILDLLRLTGAKDTFTSRLSGGEKKRLSVALELLNNPPVLFLDEPTTGLDDLSSSQCIHLLKKIARGGRTVICSIHSPSALLVALFDNIYVVSEGQCIFQGRGDDIVPFLKDSGLQCPITYTPTDFILDVATGQYGNYQDKLVRAIQNGKIQRWSATSKVHLLLRRDSSSRRTSSTGALAVKDIPDYNCNFWQQTAILLSRTFLQMRRDWNIFFMRTVVHIFIGLVVGSMFYQFGMDASKTIFNFGFCFICISVFLFVPMLPAVVWFPQEVKSVKREYFNRWYTLNSYFLSMTVSRLPLQIFQSLLYIVIVYLMTGQPLEMSRLWKFTLIMGLVCLTSEALGMAVSSRVNIMNGIFFGPAICISFLLLAVYGIGSKMTTIPLWIRQAMNLSYLRFGLLGTVSAIYGDGREDLNCPDEEIFCAFKSPRYLIKEIGMEDADFQTSALALAGYFILFKATSYLVLRQRLRRVRSTGLVFLVEKFIKTYLNLQNVNNYKN